MALFENQELTNVGWDALSTALGGGRLTFYKLEGGDGTVADADLAAMTQLAGSVTDIPITNYRIDGEGQITLIGVLASDLLDHPPGDIDGIAPPGSNGFRFRELGVWAVIEDAGPFGGTPALAVKVISTPESRGPPIPPPITGPGTTPVLYSITNAGALADYIPGSGDAGATDVVNTIEVTVVIDRA